MRGTLFRGLTTPSHRKAPAGIAPEKRRGPLPRVTIVAPMIAQYDAISAAVRDTYHMLAEGGDFDVRVITFRNDFADVPAVVVADLTDVLTHPVYLEADCLVYHFGMFNDLFNAMILGNGHARQIVYFHNITPAEHVTRAHSLIIGESYRQISNLQYADEVWAVSALNKDVLIQHGIDHERVRVVPLVVDDPKPARLTSKRAAPIEILFIGRIVVSKGVLDLVRAIDIMRREIGAPFRLRLVSNLEWSDRAYLAQVQRYVAAHRLEDSVEFCGTVDDAERERLYHAAHILAIPSYHEGFCKPVIEALRSGCIPVGYDAYNLPYIVNGLGRLVPPGDWRALAAALTDVVSNLERARATPGEPALPLDRGATSVRTFEAAALDYVDEFTYERLAALTRTRLRELLAPERVSGKAQASLTEASARAMPRE